MFNKDVLQKIEESKKEIIKEVKGILESKTLTVKDNEDVAYKIYDEEFCRKLVLEAIKETGFSQREFATLADVNQPAVSRFLRGETTNFYNIERMLKTIGCRFYITVPRKRSVLIEEKNGQNN